MKKITSLLCLFIFAFLSLSAQNGKTLFYDNFEEDISNDATFENWTTENLEGWHYWHIIPGQYMRFENTDIAQNDWLITNRIIGENIENILINFSVLFGVQGVKPKLLFTNKYNGNASESDWIEVNYTLGENENEWHNTGDIIIEKPGDTLYFAFQYKAEANTGIYLLIDNFKVINYKPLNYTLVGSSEHFEFYTNMADSSDYYLQIKDTLEARYLNYTSLWDRPHKVSIFSQEGKIKIKYCSRNDILSMDNEMNDWDCGIIDAPTNAIYLSPLSNTVHENYYDGIWGLAVNEFAQLALANKILHEENAFCEDWYLEGFGLYEMGYRPNRSSLLEKLSDIGTHEPGIESIKDISTLNLPGNKDLMASFIESKTLISCYFYISTWNDLRNWWQLLKHFYIKDNDRIVLLYSTNHFDFYGAENEIPYVEAMATNMEEQFSLQENRFAAQIHHRINICIYDNQVGKEINNRDDFQGLACGADKINTSHLDIGDYGLLNHEFMHCLVNILSGNVPPGQFLNEGLAESTDAFMTDEEILAHIYKIQDLFYHYQRKYNREPEWLEIVDNAEVNKEDGFWVDAYALGEMYWRYMNDNYPTNFWINVKNFLQNGRDWTVFGGKTTEQEGAEFIQFMKELAFVGPPLKTSSLPFFEDFETSFDGWTLMRFGVNDLWKIEENVGIEGGSCTYIVDPYWLEEKDVDSWLVSPPLNCSNKTTIEVKFAYKQHGQRIKPKIYHAGDFTGPVHSVNWTLVENISWDAQEGEWGEMKFNITNPSDRLHIGIQFLLEEDNSVSYLIDNFSVKASSQNEIPSVTSNDAISISQTSATIQGSITSDGGAEITQRGFYWSSTNTSPNSNDNVELVDGTIGEFSKVIENLNPATNYYFKAFATNAEGTATSEVKQFTTLTEVILGELPFFDDFENEYQNWIYYSADGNDQWHISYDDGTDGSKCARIYANSSPDNEDDWLISKTFNSSNTTSLKIDFSYYYFGNKYTPEFYFKTGSPDSITNLNWVKIEAFGTIKMWQWNNIILKLDSIKDCFVFAFRYHASIGESNKIMIDNFNIAGTINNSATRLLAANDFKIYPNPINGESVISFQTKTSGDVNISLYNMQGEKISTLLSKKLLGGTHTIPIDYQVETSGVYLCRLSTPEGISTIKLISR